VTPTEPAPISERFAMRFTEDALTMMSPEQRFKRLIGTVF
jgi:hypothetical protein